MYHQRRVLNNPTMTQPSSDSSTSHYQPGTVKGQLHDIIRYQKQKMKC